MEEKVLYKNNPAMFRSRPLYFVLCLIAIAAYGLGLVFLIIWYMKIKATQLTITNKRIEVRRGILSKKTSEIHMSDVRNVQARQSFFQRLFGVGRVVISSSATGGVELTVNGMKNPEKIKKIIRENR